MTTTQKRQQHEQHKDMERQGQETLKALIEEQVIHALGKPGDLLKVRVQLLWENCYRVNVFVGEDPACARIADSYFVEVHSDGNISTSTPKITKKY